MSWVLEDSFSQQILIEHLCGTKQAFILGTVLSAESKTDQTHPVELLFNRTSRLRIDQGDLACGGKCKRAFQAEKVVYLRSYMGS